MDLNQLEEIILQKVAQRTPPRMNEDTYIAKAFRYHDLDSSGLCDFQRFKQALSPFSSGLTEQDLFSIFQRYSPGNGADRLNYKSFATEFVCGVRRETGQEEEATNGRERLEDTIARMKVFLFSQGPRTVFALTSAFRDADVQNTRTLTANVFVNVLCNFFAGSGCPVSADQAENLFNTFRQAYTPNMVAYDELFLALKDEPSNERRESIRKAFRRLDAPSGLVDINEMIDAYNANRHPQVSDRTRDSSEVLSEFADTLKELVAFRRGNRAHPSDLVAWEEFEDYYKFVSCCFRSDEAFCNILQKVWDLDKAKDVSIEARRAQGAPAAGIPPKSRAGLHHWQANTLPRSPQYRAKLIQGVDLEEVLHRARRSIAIKGGLRKAVECVEVLYSMDDDVDDLLDLYEFRRGCEKIGIRFRDDEENAIFEAAGEQPAPGPRGQPTKLRLTKFLDMLHGHLSPQREQAIERAFASLGGSAETFVSPSALREGFNVDNHPLVLKGELDPAYVHTEFLDTFSLLAHVRGGCVNGMVSFSDFLAYYKVVSSNIDNDAFFELLLSRLWTQGADSGFGHSQCSPRKGTNEMNASPMAERRPPAFDGPSAYSTATEAQTQVHRRYLRKPAVEEPVPVEAPSNFAKVSPITKSNVMFTDAASTELNQVILRLRQAIARRGLKGWKMLVEHFNNSDSRKNGSIMRLDWERMQKSMGLGLSPEERESLFKRLSRDRRDGAMDYNQCLRLLKLNLNQRQVDLCSLLFDQLKEHDQEVVLTPIFKQCFDPRNTPMCMLGRKSAQQAKMEFAEAADFFGEVGGFDMEAFLDFFSMVAVLCEDQDEFQLMTTAAFGVSA